MDPRNRDIASWWVEYTINGEPHQTGLMTKDDAEERAAQLEERDAVASVHVHFYDPFED